VGSVASFGMQKCLNQTLAEQQEWQRLLRSVKCETLLNQSLLEQQEWQLHPWRSTALPYLDSKLFFCSWELSYRVSFEPSMLSVPSFSLIIISS